jgi:DNA-binding response OmpR family regulator
MPSLPPLDIVVFEANDALRDATVDALGRLGHRVRGVASASRLDEALATNTADLVILDINLFGEDGLGITRRIRNDHGDIGIFVVTANARTDDKVAAYDNGADLYLTKPVSLKELGAAINAIGRRLSPAGGTGQAVKLNQSALQLHGPLAAVDVSRRDCDLLGAFASTTGQLLDNARILALLGKSPDESSKAALEVQIARLRKKLEQSGAAGPTIKSIRGFGYQLCTRLLIAGSASQNIPPSTRARHQNA